MSKLSTSELRGYFEEYEYKVDFHGVRHLGNCYNKFSDKKLYAWNYCQQQCMEKNGGLLSVISYNPFVFTAGFVYVKDNESYFHLETPSASGDYHITANDLCDEHAGMIREWVKQHTK